jgi:acetone carboxylase gamma subunit
MDFETRLSNSEEIFRKLLIDDYHVTEEKVDEIIQECEVSLEAEASSPLYDVIFHKVVREVLETHHVPYQYVC